jgi:hypothetical protein
MKPLIQFFAVFAVLVLTWEGSSCAQPQPAGSSQPLNGSVSDYGTTFIFSPPPICSKCLETELGFQSLSEGRYLPTVISVAPFATNTDFSVLVNLLDSESPGNDRTTHFGNRFDFVARQQVFAKGGFTFAMAPRGTVFTRGVDDGRVGATAAPQYSWGKNLAAANFTGTGGIGASAANPRSDYVGSFDYFRTLDKRGTSFFLGFAHEVSAGQQTASTEQGLVLPFRNGQIEVENRTARSQREAAVAVSYEFDNKYRVMPLCSIRVASCENHRL